MQHNKQKKNIILRVIIVLIFVAFLIFTHFYILDLSNKNLENKKNNANNSKIYYPEVLIDKKQQEFQNLSLKLDDYFVEREDLVSFIEKIEFLADAQNVQMIIDNINVDETNLGDNVFPHGTLQLVVTVRGSWASVGNFLTAIENLPYSVLIKGVRFTRTNNQGTDWAMNMAFEILTN